MSSKKQRGIHPKMNMLEAAGMRNVLIADLKRMRDALDAEPEDQWQRRQYLRTLHATIEGQLSVLRWFMLEVASEFGVTLSEGELLALRDVRADVRPDGTAELDYARVPAATFFQFTLRLAYRNAGAMPWKAGEFERYFAATKRVRDRLTHPKHANDLIITEEELDTAYETDRWFSDLLIDVLDKLKYWLPPNPTE
jgi:hypothetical protein